MADPENRLSKEQKIGVVLLSVFVLLAVTLGLIQMRNTLYKPFALNASIPPLLSQQVNTPDALRYRDTDLDGLTDFDELYVYQTSPYLADTDSDGINDKQEIEQGTNPNCAEGKTCVSPELSAEALPAETGAASSSVYGETSPNTIEEYLQDPANIRQALLDSGVSQSVLDKITDDELVKWSVDIFSSTTLMNATSTNVDVSSTAKFINELMSGTTTGQ